MARTTAVIAETAKFLKQEEPLYISKAEAELLAHEHRTYRKNNGKPMPEMAFVMKQLTSGKVRIHGRVVEVRDAVDA